MSPTLNQEAAFGDRQFMVITSEKQCRIVALPSQNCVYRLQITDTDFVVRAEIVSMKGQKNGVLTYFLYKIKIKK
jgi:syntaxin-binding protein 5